ncbi:MAG TPA: hypothetical protein VEP91_11855 [Solirubrobacterales bacterium]|nr:hypothetical protein [Solirubrobacterales bacterium]
MSKKMMVLALGVVSAAFFALPTMAFAETLHLSATTTFSIASSATTNLTTTEGPSISCTSTTGSGTFSTTTGGSMSLLIHGCTSVFLACTSAGQSSGTVAASFSFDLITVSAGSAGILLTPSSSEEITGQKVFSEFSCSGVTIHTFGKGLIGTLSSTLCSGSVSTATVSFASSSAGHQNDKTYTGNTFDLSSDLTASHPTFSFDGTASLTLGAARTVTCT